MAAKANSNTQKIELTVNGEAITFEVTRESYNRLINTMGPGQKVAPMHNFLMSTVIDDDKKKLADLLAQHPGAEVTLGGELFENYSSDLDVVAKKL